MAINKKIIENFISCFFILTLFINVLNFINTEIYNNSIIAEYNEKISINTGIITEKEFCLKLQQPFLGMVIYRELFSLSFFLIELSIAIILFGFILTISKKRILPIEYRYKLVLFLPILILSWVILIGSWMSVVPAFYNCTKYFSL